MCVSIVWNEKIQVSQVWLTWLKAPEQEIKRTLN